MNHQLSTNLTDPGRVRVLLVPVGPIPKEIFRRYSRLIARNDAIKLADIIPDVSTSNPMFSNHQFKAGKMRFHFATSHQAGESSFLEEFQVHKQVLGVIGISTFPYTPDAQAAHAHFTTLCEKASPDQREEVRGVTVVPNVGDTEFYARTLMVDFAGGLLSAFSILAAAIERRSIIHSPSPNSPSLSSTNGSSATSSNLGVPSPNTSPGSTGGSSTPARSLSPFYRATSPSNGNSSNGSQTREEAAKEARTRKRTPGRAQKLLGDLYLVAGKTPEAIRAYVLAVDAARSSSDFIWWASATEGLCSAVQQLAAADPPDVGPLPALQAYTADLGVMGGGMPASTGMTTSSQLRAFLREVPARYREVVNMYERGRVWPILYAEACLKMAREAALIERDRFRVEEVSAWASRGWAYAGTALGIGEQVGVATATAEIFDLSGARRKRAFWLRRVELLVWSIMRREMAEGERIGEGIRRRILSCLSRICPAFGVEEFVPGRKPYLEMPGPLDNADDEEEGLESLGGVPFGWPTLQVDILRECLAVSEALGEYERTIFYGTQLLRKRRRHLHRDEQVRIAGVLQRIVTEAKSLNIIPDEGVPGVWWGESFLRSLEVCRPPPTRAPHVLPGGKGLSSSSDASSTAASGDPFIYNPYAPVQPGIGDEEGEVLTVQHEPLWIMVTVWNPFYFDLELEDVQLVVDGPVTLKTDSASTILSGGSVATLRLSCTVTGLAPTPSGKIKVAVGSGSGKKSGDSSKEGKLQEGNKDQAGNDPEEDPMLTIHGITATAFGGIRQEFRVLGEVPLSAIETERRRIELRRRAHIKKVGLESYEDQQASEKKSSTDWATTSGCHPLMQLPIVGALPVLRVKSTSLAHGAMMLFEGERGKMTITLENISKVPVNFLLPSFTETASAAASVATRSGRDARQSREDAYEADSYAAETHAFMWRDENPTTEGKAEPAMVSIAPGESHVLTIDVVGKRGCAGGTIRVAYGRTGTAKSLFRTRDTEDTPEDERFVYTRQVTVPVMLTVRRAVELMDMDAFSVSTEQLLEDHDLATILHREGVDDDRANNLAATYCLLAMDVRNTWSSQIDLTVALRRQWDREEGGRVELNYFIAANSTKRLLMPVQRMLLSREDATKPIPTAANKQFIVSKAKVNPEQEELSRRVFWYKEALLSQIATSWVCVPDRAGSLDLRGVRLTEPMLEVLSAPEVEIIASLEAISHGMNDANEGGMVEKIGSGKYRVQELEMVQIAVRIRNRKAHDVKLFLRIQPMFDHGNGKADCHLKEILAVNGQPQTVLPKIKERSEYVHYLPVCFLAGGYFTFACHAERTEDQGRGTEAVESVPSTGSGSGVFQGSTVHVEVTTQL